MNSTERCRLNGWGPGTLLTGDEGYGPTVICITAVGEENVLARPVSDRGEPTNWPHEGLWCLDYRDWKPLKATEEA